MSHISFEPKHPIEDVTEFFKNIAIMLSTKQSGFHNVKLVSIEGPIERKPTKVEIDSFAYQFRPDKTPDDVRVLEYIVKVKSQQYDYNKKKYMEVENDIKPSLYIHGVAGVIGGWTWSTDDGRPAYDYNVHDYVECLTPDYGPQIASIKIENVKPKKKKQPKYSNQFVIIATAMHGDADKYEDVEISRRLPLTPEEEEQAENEASRVGFDLEEADSYDYSYGIKIDNETELKRALEVIGALCNRPWNWMLNHLETTRAFKEYLHANEDWPSDIARGGDGYCTPTEFHVIWYDETGKKHPVKWKIEGSTGELDCMSTH